MPRKVIQLLVNNDTEHQQGCFIALCDDGSIWERGIRVERGASGQWTSQVVEWVELEGPSNA